MVESEGEIEYLEEDADIVQQCVLRPLSVRPTHNDNEIVTTSVSHLTSKSQPLPLLVERRQVQKRKIIKKEEDDSEYDPSEDNLPPSPPSPPVRKKRVVRPLKKVQVEYSKPSESQRNVITETVSSFKTKRDLLNATKEQFLVRKKYNIRIPDYDDPLCLPVRAIKAEDSDRKRLNNWNNVCLEHFKHCDTMLKPERGDTKRSMRTAVFRNVVNKQTGNAETTIWSKTCVENEDGDKKSEIFQCVLPRYKEKRVLGNYILGNQRHRPVIRTVNEVILSKENHKDGEALVVFKPRESLSAIYGLIDKRKKPEEDEEGHSRDEDSKMFLQELTTCKVCATCFQTSWRGLRKYRRKSLVCPICARTYVTIYNLLSHFKTHSATDVFRYKKIISHILSDIVGYHYKCRMCRRQFDSIKALRGHVVDHQSKETFTCEVCNHLVNGQVK